VDVMRARRAIRLAAATGVIVLAVIGFAAFELTSHASQSGASASAGATRAGGSRTAIASAEPVPSASASIVTPSNPSASPSVSASKSPVARASAATGAQVVLTPVNAAAFGENGTADGDNPQLAGNVLSDPASGWMTDWYATATFGSLAPGTGLLLDMGRTVTVSTVRADLGPAAGATLELRAGAQSAMGAFQTLAVRQGTGGAVTLTAAKPVQARYVLLWFTRLPPDGNGTYQAIIHGITVEGRP
jgi:hypothetical protein